MSIRIESFSGSIPASSTLSPQLGSKEPKLNDTDLFFKRMLLNDDLLPRRYLL